MTFKKSLNIWLLKDGEMLPGEADSKKLRTWRLGEALANRGHSVTWWTSNFFHIKKKKICEGNKVLQLNDNLKVNFIDCGVYKKNISLERIKHHFILGKKFSELAKKEKKPDIIIASLPTLEFPIKAIKYAKKYNIPVIIDVRDMWPDIFASYFPCFLRPLLSIPLYFYSKKIKYCLQEAQGIVSISDDLLTWALKKGGLTKDSSKKVFYLGHDESSPETKEPIEGLKDLLKNKVIFSYLGSFCKSYEVDLILKAAKTLEKDENFNGFFILAGNGDMWPSIKEKAKNIRNIKVLGWLNKAQSFYLMNTTDVSLVPNKTTAFPNKVFESLFFGKPMIFCMEGEAKSVLTKTQTGIHYQQGNVHSLIEGIRILLDEKKIQDMKKNARELYDNHLRSDKIYTEYCEYIENLSLINSTPTALK